MPTASTIADNHRLLSQPAMLSAGRFHLVTRKMADDLTYGTDPSRFVGAGLDFAQSRPMQLGDSIRSIDWRVTARTGRVHVKDYEADKRMSVYIVADTSASMGVTSTAVSKHAVGVWIVAVLAQLALNRRSPVAVVGAGERESTVKPTTSRGQVTRWIESIRRPGLAERTNLCRALTRVETISLHRAIIAVVSDLHERGATEQIKRLAQHHDVMVLQPMDPVERDAGGLGFFRAAEAETGESFVAAPGARWFGDEAASASDPLGLIGAGADHAIIRTDQAIIPALRRVLNARRGRGRVAR